MSTKIENQNQHQNQNQKFINFVDIVNKFKGMDIPDIDASFGSVSCSSSHSSSSAKTEINVNKETVIGNVVIKNRKETVGDIIQFMELIQEALTDIVSIYFPGEPPLDTAFYKVPVNLIVNESKRLNDLCDRLQNRLEKERRKSKQWVGGHESGYEDSDLESDAMSPWEEDENSDGELKDDIYFDNLIYQKRTDNEKLITIQKHVSEFEDLVFDYQRNFIILEMFWERYGCSTLDGYKGFTIDYDTLL